MIVPQYKLRNWIPLEKLNHWALSSNPCIGADQLMKEHSISPSLYLLNENINNWAIEILKNNPSHIMWQLLSGNTNECAGEILLRQWNAQSEEWCKESFNWTKLSKNPSKGAIVILFAQAKNNPDILDWSAINMNTNPDIIQLMKNNIEYVDWVGLNRTADNDNTTALLHAYPDKIDWGLVSHDRRDSIISLLVNRPEIIDWYRLSGNPTPTAIYLLRENIDKINPMWMSQNPCDEAINILRTHYPNDIDVHILAHNSCDEAVIFLRELQKTFPHIEYIDWDFLSGVPSREAIKTLNLYPQKIVWGSLARNTHPHAIKLFDKYFNASVNNDVDIWMILSANPNIFTFDWEKMRKQCYPLCEEIVKKVYSPFNVKNNIIKYNYDLLDDVYMTDSDDDSLLT